MWLLQLFVFDSPQYPSCCSVCETRQRVSLVLVQAVEDLLVNLLAQALRTCCYLRMYGLDFLPQRHPENENFCLEVCQDSLMGELKLVTKKRLSEYAALHHLSPHSLPQLSFRLFVSLSCFCVDVRAEC